MAVLKSKRDARVELDGMIKNRRRIGHRAGLVSGVPRSRSVRIRSDGGKNRG